jgi:hypothetical protein
MSPDEQTEKAVPAFAEQRVYCKEVADTYDKAFAPLLLLQYDLLLLLQWFAKPGRVLDLGCGTGRAMLALGQCGYDVTGVDLSPSMLARAREKLDAEGLTNAKLVEGNLADLPMDKLAPPYELLCLYSSVIRIGQGVLLTRLVAALTAGHAISDREVPIISQGIVSADVVVEDGCWIGYRAILMPWAHVGRGTVVGAGAAVTGDLPPMAVAGGVPAKVIRER